MSYFDALYVCFCSLLKIGYGDFTPKLNGGRPFFVVWSLIAIPTMTMLRSDERYSDTVVAAYKHSTERFSDYLVMPRQGAYKMIFSRVSFLRRWMKTLQEKQRPRRGFEVDAEVNEIAHR